MKNNEQIAIKRFIPKQLLYDLSQIRKELLMFDRLFIPHFKETLDVFNLIELAKTGSPLLGNNIDEIMTFYKNKLIIDSTNDFPSDAKPLVILIPQKPCPLYVAQAMSEKRTLLKVNLSKIIEDHEIEQENLLCMQARMHGNVWGINIIPIVSSFGALNPKKISANDINGLKHKSEEFPEIPDAIENMRKLVLQMSFNKFPTLSKFTCFDDFQKIREELKNEVLSLKMLISDFAKGGFSMKSVKTEIERSVNVIESSFKMANLEFHHSRVGVVVSSSWEIYNEYQSHEKSNITELDIDFHIFLMQQPCEVGEIKAYCINDFS